MSEKYPDSLVDIAKEAVKKHSDSQKAAGLAYEKWKATSDYSGWVNRMVFNSVLDLIHHLRGSNNARTKRAHFAAADGQSIGLSEGIANAIAELCVLNMLLGGKRIGDMTGTEVRAQVEVEERAAEGHRLNAQFLEKIAGVVPPEKIVRDVLSEKKAKLLFYECGGRSIEHVTESSVVSRKKSEPKKADKPKRKVA